MDIRPLSGDDLEACLRLSEAAGWNQTPADWQRSLRLCGDLAIGIEQDGRIVATATAICYARELAWIGMVLTLPDYRGRGFAAALMAELLNRLRGLGIGWVKLDATAMGEPVYARMGFERECAIERWAGQGSAVAAGSGPGVTVDPELDRRAFGADRMALIASFPVAGARVEDAYAFIRPGARAHFLGPVVASTAAGAEGVVAAAQGQVSGPVLWDILPGNPEAVRMASSVGFRRVRELVRMRLCLDAGRPEPASAYKLVYGGAGFEWG